MRDRRGKGKCFLLFACAILMICLVRQGALLRTLPPSQSLSFHQTVNAKQAASLEALTPCQLSAYSLSI